VETSGDRARFRLLEVIRQYAAGCLASSGELACHQRRHARWYASRAESLDPDLGSGVVGEPSPWFAVESGNLRAALATSLGEMPDRALVMAVAMWRSWMARGGSMARTAAGATAFSQRQSPYLINCIARTPTAEGFEANRAWARGTRDSMARFGAGQTYVNSTGEGDEDKVRASYPAETYARLAAVKTHYDPVNRFRLNQNIRPAGTDDRRDNPAAVSSRALW